MTRCNELLGDSAELKRQSFSIWSLFALQVHPHMSITLDSKQGIKACEGCIRLSIALAINQDTKQADALENEPSWLSIYLVVKTRRMLRNGLALPQLI